MRIPDATYRLQFGPDFGFRDACGIVSYLRLLGISDIYASPIFYCAEGSTHGYDVCDPDRLNPELGSDEDFESLADKVREQQMGWLQDIVPNHMAYSARNRRLMETLKFGPRSAYGEFFDIDWEHPALDGKLLAPFLGRHYRQCLDSGEIELRAAGGWARMGYYGLELPLSRETSFCLGEKDSAGENAGGRYTAKDFPEGDLDGIIARQHFAPSCWKRADEEINYRRFFTINGLIGVRVEDESIFDETHRFVLELTGRGIITGLRVDHIDGLYGPAEYLRRLREKSGGMYTLVEKILGLSEDIPRDWPVEGTTGYKFLNYVNGLFCKADNEAVFSRIYEEFTGPSAGIAELAREKKRLILESHLGGDLDNLARLLKKIAGSVASGRDFSLPALREALAEFLCAFPVYRSYIEGREIRPEDRCRIQAAAAAARELRPARAAEIDFTAMLLLDDERLRPCAGRLHFIRRLQQLTGPLMAKGFEDTLFYVYNRLLSLNEVGGEPGRFGICPSVFHGFAESESANWPHTLNATATHDTKRGEDARARINVLSEIPLEWERNLRHWSGLNAGKKKTVRGVPVPGPEMEYFLYQALIGAYPFQESERGQFPSRFREYLVKAAREAKTFTDWAEPDPEYEAALADFAGAILDPGLSHDFLDSFLPFQARVAGYGVYNSLSQLLIKITAPGVPDLYRGTELWSLDFVDPDNRRPVDFAQRRRHLEEIIERSAKDLTGLVSELLETRGDGRLKLYVTWRALKARKDFNSAFRGDYRAVKPSGMRSQNVLCYLREANDCRVLVVAPRFFTVLAPLDRGPFGREAWHDTFLSCPESEGVLWTEEFTGRQVRGTGEMPVADVLTHFPIALLTAGT